MRYIQESILLYFETVINTFCGGIQVSTQKYVNISLLSKIQMVSKHEKVDFSLSDLQFYTFSAHGAHKSSLPEPHSRHAPNDSTSHAGPIRRHAYCARKVLCKIGTLHLHRLRHHHSHHFQIQFPSLIH